MNQEGRQRFSFIKEERVRGSVLNGLESHLVFTPNYRMYLISWHE